MDSDLCGPPESALAADEPVPGDLVSRLIERGHDGVCPPGAADREPQPPLTGELDVAASRAADMPSGRVQDGCSRLIEELLHARVIVTGLVLGLAVLHV